MWLKSGLRPRTGWLSASQSIRRQLIGRAVTEGKDSGGSDVWMELGQSKRRKRESGERKGLGVKRNKRA